MTTDPRDLGGDIAGDDDPFGKGNVVIDTSRAILMDALTMAQVDRDDDEVHVAVLIEGRINRSRDRAKVMVLGDLDMLASFVSESLGLSMRMGVEAFQEFDKLVTERLAKLPKPDWDEGDE